MKFRSQCSLILLAWFRQTFKTFFSDFVMMLDGNKKTFDEKLLGFWAMSAHMPFVRKCLRLCARPTRSFLRYDKVLLFFLPRKYYLTKLRRLALPPIFCWYFSIDEANSTFSSPKASKTATSSNSLRHHLYQYNPDYQPKTEAIAISLRPPKSVVPKRRNSLLNPDTTESFCPILQNAVETTFHVARCHVMVWRASADPISWHQSRKAQSKAGLWSELVVEF